MGKMVGTLGDLSTEAGLVNYQRRRQAMQEWCLDMDAWHEITGRQPRTNTADPGRPKRQEASAFTWACVTRASPGLPPPHRGNAAGASPQNLDRTPRQHVVAAHPPRPAQYYAELRKLLIEHARHLASRIEGHRGHPAHPVQMTRAASRLRPRATGSRAKRRTTTSTLHTCDR